MKLLISILLLPITVLADEKRCEGVADIALTQAVGRATLNKSMKSSDIEPWRMMWFIYAEKLDKLKVKKKRQRQISKEILAIEDISGDYKVDSFLISSFYYAYCILPKKERKYKKLKNIEKSKLVNCWNMNEGNQKYGTRECIVGLMRKP